MVERLRGNAALAEFGDAFRRLQEARHEADYDHLVEVTHGVASEVQRLAARALALLDGLGGTPDLAEFYALIALHTALR